MVFSMGLFDEVILDKRTKSLLREYAGDGVFQTKYWKTEEGYIRLYNFMIPVKRICCPISLDIDLLVKPRAGFIYDEPFMRRLKLEEIGIPEKIQATASTILYFSCYEDLAKLLIDNGFQLEKTVERYSYRKTRKHFAVIPLEQVASLKLKKIKLSSLLDVNEHESKQEDNLLELLKKHRIRVYMDNGEYGVAVPPGAIIEIHPHSLEIYIEEMRKHPYKEEEWIKSVQDETKLELKVTIEHQFPTQARIEASVVSYLDDKVREQITLAVETLSNLRSRILQ